MIPTEPAGDAGNSGGAAPVPPAGLYVHVPFCRRKCAYCAFYSIPRLDDRARWLAAVLREIGLRAEPELACDTVYFGGGTPSLLDPGDVSAVLDALRSSFRVLDGAEVSIEANPGTVDAARLAGFRGAGVNRIAIGAQSFEDEDLRFLGRIHSRSDIIEAVEGARAAGFSNVGLDLIYGLPGRDESHWERQIEQAAALAPEHLSCYALSVEEGTPLAALELEGKIELPDEDASRSQFLLTLERAAGLGYPHYEVSNFATGPGLRCRHNWKYWTGARYLGFGPAAHSFKRPVRSWNLPDLGRYIDAMETGAEPPGDRETLSPHQLALESLYLGLRTSEGADLGRLERELCPGFRAANSALLDWLQAQDLARMFGQRLVLTREGLAVSDSIAPMFECGD